MRVYFSQRGTSVRGTCRLIGDISDKILRHCFRNQIHVPSHVMVTEANDEALLLDVEWGTYVRLDDAL